MELKKSEWYFGSFWFTYFYPYLFFQILSINYVASFYLNPFILIN